MNTKVIGLDKIYLHHSVYPGRTTMIDCHGHHNSSGGNGSGKTTLQKLIPIFYGEQVNKVVPTQVRSTKESFTKYYLKSEASFVAFEYTNPKGKCCVVLHKKQEQLRYRFIKGALTELFFTDESKPKLQKGLPIHEYLGTLKSADKDNAISRIISTAEDYRAILQNDKSLIRTRKQGIPDIQTLANAFSLTGVGSHMTLMHKLTYALQTRTSMFSGLEDMIVSTQFDFVTPEKPKHIENKSLANDLCALHDFRENEALIRECIRLSTRRLEHAQETARLRNSLFDAVEKEEERKEQFKTTISQIESQLEDSKARFEHDRDQLTETRAQQKGTIKQLEKSIDTIHKDKDEWENVRNIQFKKDQYTQIDILKATSEQATDHYNQLLEGISEVRDTLDRQTATLEINTKETCLTLESKQTALKEDLQKRIDDINRQKDIERTRTADKTEALRCNQEKEKESLLIERTQLEAQVQQVSNTEDEQIAEAFEEENYHTFCQKEDVLAEQLTDAGNSLRDAKTRVDQKQDSIYTTQQHLQTEEAQLETLHKQRYPAGNSLLAFLKKEKANWAETIGKVIHPELLAHEGLNPTLIIESLESLYGVELDLPNLSIPPYAQNDESLETAISAKEEGIERLKKQQKHLEKDFAILAKALNEHSATVQELEFQHQSAKKHKSASFAKLQQVRSANQKAREERKYSAKKLLATCEKSLVETENLHKEQRQILKDSSKNYLNELTGLINAERSDVEISIQHLEDEKTAHKKRLKENIDELKQAFEQTLSKKGLNTDIEKAAQQRKEAASAAYSAARDSVNEIEKYENWFENIYKELPATEAQLHNTQELLLQTDSEIQDKTAAFTKEKNASIKKSQQLKEQLKELQAQLSDAAILLEHVGSFPKSDNMNSEKDLYTLTILLQREFKDYQQITKNTLEKTRQSQRLIEKRQETHIYKQWENIYDDYTAKSPHEPLTNEFELNLPPLFEELLDNYLPQIQSSTVETIIAVAESIDKYYQSLKQIHQEITSVSKKLSNRINTNQQIKALSDIGIRLVSKIEECGAWAEMSSFNTLWSDSTVKADRSLPSTTLGDSLREVIEALEYAHKTPDIKSLISLVVCLKENGNYKEITSDAAMNDASSNGLSLLAVIAIYIGMSRYLCPDNNVSLTWPVDELSTIDLDNIANLFSMLNAVNIRLFSAFPTKEHNILKHFDTCHELVYKKGAMTMLKEAPEISLLAEQLKQQMEQNA